MTDASRPAPADPLATLAALAGAAARGDDLDSALTALLEQALAALGASDGAIAIQDPDRASLELAVTAGMSEEAIDRARDGLADPTSPFVKAVSSREANWARPGGADGTVAHADLPLVTRRDGIDAVVGGLTVAWSAPRELSAADRAIASAVADLAAVVIDRARLASLIAERAEWFERMSQSDPLTGLANHRVFGRVLELELARAARQGGEVSVALFDVDDFVATNRDRGHEAGDDVLRAVASVLNDSVRLVDTVARIGGDEFVLVAPGSAGVTVARRVLDGVAALRGPGDRSISVSAGVARFPADGTTPDELVAAAAAALETARSQGRATLHEAGRQPTG